MTRGYVLAALVALFAGLLLTSGASGRVGDAPKATSPPSIHQSGAQLKLDNGGWFAWSGPVDWYVFQFTRDGALAKGSASVPSSTQWGSPALPGQYPDDPTANVYTLTSADVGHVFCGDVWGGTHSKYVYADGTVAYDVTEWGHTNAVDGSQLQPVCLTAQPFTGAPPATSPNPSAAAAEFENVALPERRASTLYATWKRFNPREASKAESYEASLLAGVAATAPSLVTHTGREYVAIDVAYAYSRGLI